MEEKRVELEPAVRIGDRELIPIAWTLGRRMLDSHRLMVVMCREALGVIVLDEAGTRAFLSDGRDLSLEELLAEHPDLCDAVASLQ